MIKLNLYLFTSQFPYGKQETFLESEVKFLSEYFNITILPRNLGDGKIRTIDKKICIDTGLALFGRKKRYSKKFGWLNRSFWLFLIYEKRKLYTVQAIKRINKFAIEYSQVYNFLKKGNIEPPGILYSYWFNGVAFALADYKSKRAKNFKAITKAHGYDVYEEIYQPPFWPLREKVIDKLDKIFFISNDGLKEVSSKYGSRNKMQACKLGIINPFQKPVAISVDIDVLKFLSVSNLYPNKRVFMIAKYLKQFALENPQLKIRWDHYGDGLRLKNVEAELENSPVNFISNIIARIPNTKLLEIISTENYDLLINLSMIEGLPVSMMEAISNGIPIVATNVGGVSEIVNDITGVLIPKDLDYETFSEAIKYITMNISKEKKRRTDIVSFWKENYSAENNYCGFANEIIDLYNKPS